MNHHDQLIAYLATLAALVTVVVAGLITAALFPEILGKVEAFGFGTITGGLIGVLRIPAQRQVTIDNPPSNPVQTEEAR